MISQNGMAATALLLADFDYVGIGESATGESNAHDDLQTPTLRKQGTPTRVQTTYANDTYQCVVTFSSGDGLSGTDTIQEAGAFDAASSGNMLFRKTFTGKSCDWDAGDTLEITAKCQVKQGA